MRFTFTTQTRDVLSNAALEAKRLKHDYVGTEHLLLGLLGLVERVSAAGDALAKSSPGDLLAKLDLEVGAIRDALTDVVRTGKATLFADGLPYTSRAKKTLEYAMAEARELGHEDVRPEHLLLGLLRERGGIAAQILTSFGVTEDGALQALFGVTRHASSKGSHTSEPGRRSKRRTSRTRLAVMLRDALLQSRRAARDRDRRDARPVWFLEVDPEADAAIYEQIIAGVEEAVATGQLEPSERIPTVRQLAEELGVAPGTVARAYTELERRGVLETGGARGTRVAPPSEVRAKLAAEQETTLEGLMRPVAVAAFHMGANAEQLRSALERAMTEIY